MLHSRKALVFGRALSAVALLAFATTAAHAQQKLRWKFKPGEKLNYSMAQTMKMSMVAQGRNIDMKMNQTMDMVWQADKVASDGSYNMTQIITRIRFVMSGGPIGKVEYDSANPNNAGGNPILASVTKMYGALVGKPITMKMTPLGEFKDVKMPKAFLDAVGNAAGGQVPGVVNKDTLKQMITQSGVAFPSEAVAKGKTWNKDVKLNNNFGVIKVDTTYTYQGADGSTAKIGISPKMSITPKPGAPFTLKLAKQDGGGVIRFDVAKGHIQSTSMKQKMVMEISVAGQVIEQTIDQTIEMKLGRPKATR